MDICTYVKNSGISVYALSKKSGVPYTTLHSIITHKSSIDDCRVSTIKKIAKSIGVEPGDIISNSLSEPVKHNYIVDSIKINKNNLPKLLRNFIEELEEYDRDKDTIFYDAADTMLLMANRFLSEGMIDKETYLALSRKYPIG